VKGIPIEVIDTRTAMMAQGFSVLAALKVGCRGWGTFEIFKRQPNRFITQVTLFLGDGYTPIIYEKGGRIVYRRR